MYWTEIGIIFGLILVNGFFAGSELALVSASRARLGARARQGHRGAQRALDLLADPTRLLSSVQIGITLVGIVTGVYSGAVFAEDLAHVLKGYPPLTPYAEEAAFGAVVVLVTYLSLILGELVPKRLALAHAEVIASFVAYPMQCVARVTAPLVWVLQVSTEAITRLLPLQSAPSSALIEDELRALIVAGTKEGIFLRREKEMIEGVLRLADLSIESVMVQRGDIVWLDRQAPLDALWSKARASGHTRFLVCDAQLEQLLGVISLADLGEAVRVGRLDHAQFIHPPLYVPPSVSVLKLLELFRDATVHLAVVTGEYGEIRGLATPMDILRAIAGELPEMGSRDAAKAVRREDGSWLFDGQVNIHEVERLLTRDDLAHNEDYRTIGGLVLWHLGRLPVTGESLTWRGLRFEVVDMDGPRIDQVLVMVDAAGTQG